MTDPEARSHPGGPAGPAACGRCGHPARPDDSFCSGCGARHRPPTAHRSEVRWGVVVAVVGGFALALAAAAAVVAVSTHGPAAAGGAAARDAGPDARPDVTLSQPAQDGLALAFHMGYGGDISGWRYGDNACDLFVDVFRAARSSATVDFTTDDVEASLVLGGNVRATLENQMRYRGYADQVGEVIAAGTTCADYIAAQV